MTSFSSGKYALMVSDRSGQTFPWKEMVREWNGAWVHFSEYELARALSEDGSSTSTYIAPKVYFPGT